MWKICKYILEVTLLEARIIIHDCTMKLFTCSLQNLSLYMQQHTIVVNNIISITVFSTEGNFVPQGTLAVSGDSFGCQNWEGATGNCG